MLFFVDTTAAELSVFTCNCHRHLMLLSLFSKRPFLKRDLWDSTAAKGEQSKGEEAEGCLALGRGREGGRQKESQNVPSLAVDLLSLSAYR